MIRKALICALVATAPVSVFLPASAEARGSYCTRHRAACERRRAAEQEAAAEHQRWYNALSPIEKLRYDLSAAQAWAERERIAALQMQRDLERARRDLVTAQEEVSALKTWRIFLLIIGASLLVGLMFVGAWGSAQAEKVKRRGLR